MRTLTLTDEQAKAASAIETFIADKRADYFVLHGLAGTGKTTVLSHVAREHPHAKLCTLTGKAASVLRRKTDLPAGTIHSTFYQLERKERDAKGRVHLNWRERHKESDLHGELLLLDECSMIDDRMAQDILRTGTKIVACGDPGQLPPVKGAQFFHTPDFTLREIHRQALDSPIIRQAHAVRRGGAYEPDGDAFRIVRQAEDDDVRQTGAILCWTNRTKDAANAYARRLHGFWQPFPQVGEPVMCLKNVAEFGVFNGAVYTLLAPFIEGDHRITLDVDGTETAIPNVIFKGVGSSLPDTDEPVTSFDFGYAMTVHKAQGSEWPSVILMDEYRREECRREWLYTGITRAADRILIVR